MEKINAELIHANEALAGEIREHRITQSQKARLIDELQAALADVKTLSGFLPICAHCKKIRDDRGDWNKLEAYLHEHAGTRFSHSVCPDCLLEHYGEYINLDDLKDV